MFAASCRSETASDLLPQVPAFLRARGELRAEFVATGGRTRVARVYETGGLRLRFPNVARGCEAVIVNSAGGVAGGDQARFSFDVGPAGDVTLTTQAAEKIYRAQGNGHSDRAKIDITLRIGAGACAEWLPQETILFDRTNLVRRLDIDMAEDASLTLLESIVFGRLAMGETAIEGSIHDRWRVRRGGKLIFAEDLRVEGPLTQILDLPVCGDGARACATLLHTSPDAEQCLDAIRISLVDAQCEWGASAWNGFALVRMVALAPEKLRSAIGSLLSVIRGREAPRVWS